ncbi:DNA primase family protein [Schaalia vaccimaxillae]|uniref:DNA primase family protein n=1 Tax=Schaalia vaccimaxillae TaxID=183916 RepID=UPI0003B3F59C|nr:phage/plasmid primase, P4 family [Schaalia vaccimaxillae]
MTTTKNRPGTAEGTEAIHLDTTNRTDVRHEDQPDQIIYDDLFGRASEDPALDVLCAESPGDLEKSELLRQASEAVFAHVRRLRERGSKVTPAQLEKHLLTMLNELVVVHNKEARDRLPRYQELPPTLLAEVLAFERRLVLVGTGTPENPLRLPLAMYEDEGELEGTYRLLDEEGLHGLLRPYCYTISLQQARETYAHLRAIVPVVDETMEANLVPVRNGVYNTSTKQLEAFTPERVFLTKSPVRYDPQAVSPTKTLSDGDTWTFDEWLADLFDEDEERVTLFWEIVAASLRVYKSYEKAFFFYSSSGSSGKSTLLHLMRNILGQRNCASLSLGAFGKDFGCEPVLGVSAVLTDETDTHGFMKECKEFKQYVTHDVITVQRKGVKAVQWKPRGIVIQAGNELPEFSDKTEAMTRRFIFVPFDRCFAGEFDPSIKSELMVDREVQEYVLRRALELPEFVSFTEGEATKALRQQARVQNDSVLEWWLEERGEFQTNLIPWDFAFDVFSRWVARTNPGMKSAMSRKKFVQRLRAAAEDDSMWNPMRSKDSALVIANYWVTNVEPLAVQYGLVEWYVPGAPSISGSPSAVARTPRVRGLLRINPSAMPAPAQPTQVVTI